MKFRLVFLYTLLVIIPSSLFAAPADDAAIRQDIQIRQRQDQELRELERKRNIDELNRAQEKSEKIESSTQSKKFIDDGQCRVINNFEISGNKELDVAKFVIPYQGKCLTRTDLKNLKDSIWKYYLDRGYFLAQVYFGVDEMMSGKIKILIEEGKASSLQIKDDSKINEFMPWRRSLQRFFAFGPYANKTLNLRDIEQGLDQMNRLSSNNAKTDLLPGSKEGYSDVVINNQVKNISKPSFGINNSGNENTGRTRENFVLDQDNLIGVNDNIYFSHQKSNYSGTDKKYFKSNYIGFSIPFTYYTFGGNYSDSKYFTTNKGGLVTTTSSGNTKSSSYYISRVITRSKRYKISAKTEINNATNENYLNDVFLDSSSRTLTVAKFSFDNIFYTNFGSVFLQPKYNRGTKLMNALQDGNDLAKDAQRAQFDSCGLYGAISSNFAIPKTKIALNHNLTFDSQISEDRLYSSEQISLGGRYTIRGFNESTISGDNGYYFRNDLSGNLSQFLPDKMKDGFVGKVSQKLNAGIFYDYGYVRNNIINDETDKGYMSGTGAKISYNGEYLKMDLTYSYGLHSPNFLRNVNKTSKDNESIYLDVKIGLF